MPFCMAEECTRTYESGLHTHHIHPRADGGSNRPGNLITLCPFHHSSYEHLTRRLPDSTKRVLLARKKLLESQQYGMEIEVLLLCGFRARNLRLLIDRYPVRLEYFLRLYMNRNDWRSMLRFCRLMEKTLGNIKAGNFPKPKVEQPQSANRRAYTGFGFLKDKS